MDWTLQMKCYNLDYDPLRSCHNKLCVKIFENKQLFLAGVTFEKVELLTMIVSLATKTQCIVNNLCILVTLNYQIYFVWNEDISVKSEPDNVSKIHKVPNKLNSLKYDADMEYRDYKFYWLRWMLATT